jgi:hypothetical protein
MAARDNVPRVVVPLSLASVPPLLVAVVISRYGLNVPLRDQWRFALHVVDFFSGDYGVERLWQPSGDHRVALPRAVMLMLAACTRWDVRAEMWFDFALAVASLILLGDLARRTLGCVAPCTWAWTVPVSSAAVFSMAAWQSWTFGWMMTAYLAVLGVSLTAWALGCYATSGRGSWWMLLGATIAALSYLSGLVMVVLVPLAVVLLPRRSPDRRLRHVMIATVWAGILLALYFVGYPRASVTRSVASIDARALGYFVLRYLGAPLGTHDGALAWGAGGVAAIATSAALVWWGSPQARRALLPWLLLAAFAASSGLATGLGRRSAGAGAALLSRYTMLSCLFWTSVLPCLVLAASAWPSRVRTAALAALVAVGVVAGRAYVATWQRGVEATKARHASLLVAAGCLQHVARAPTPCLQRLARQSPALVRRVAPRLAQLRLGPYTRTDRSSR